MYMCRYYCYKPVEERMKNVALLTYDTFSICLNMLHRKCCLILQVVRLSDIVDLAHEISVDVKFELPL